MEEQNKATEDISKAIHHLKSISDEINDTMTQQASSSEEITRVVQHVNDIAETNEQGAVHNVEASNELIGQSHTLDQQLCGIKVN